MFRPDVHGLHNDPNSAAGRIEWPKLHYLAEFVGTSSRSRVAVTVATVVVVVVVAVVDVEVVGMVEVVMVVVVKVVEVVVVVFFLG